MKLGYAGNTPKLWRRIGDGLLAFSTTVSVYAIAEDMDGLALASVLLGAAGKFITNLFKEDDTPAKEEPKKEE